MNQEERVLTDALVSLDGIQHELRKLYNWDLSYGPLYAIDILEALHNSSILIWNRIQVYSQEEKVR